MRADFKKMVAVALSLIHIFPVELINALLIINFYKIAKLAAQLCNLATESYSSEINKLTALVKNTYIDKDGSCVINKQTAVAMLIYYDVYDDIKPLKVQLKRLIEDSGFHHDCGMVGLRRLYMALNKCGLQEYAYKILVSKTFPSYGAWFENGATTLWEFWHYFKHEDSRNHHMYSDFMSWMIKTLVGINAREPGFGEIEIKPFFPENLTWVRGICKTSSGSVGVFWERQKNGVHIEITLPSGMSAYYKGKKLNEGVTILDVNDDKG